MRSHFGGRWRRTRDIYPKRFEVGGPSPWIKCEATGKWYDRKTGAEVAVKSVKFSDLLAGRCRSCGMKHDEEAPPHDTR